MYHNYHSTVLSGLTITNSADRAAYLVKSSLCLVRKSLRIYPSLLLIIIAGILMPVPVPSSDMMTLLMSSFLSSIITAKLPPAFSIFLTLVTNVQSPLSTKKIGVKIPSGSPEKSLVKLDL